MVEQPNTISAYLGADFQQKLMWQLLVEPEYCEKTLPQISVDYFDDPVLKKLFIIMQEYYDEFEKVPNLQNLSINHAINRYKTPNNIVESESLFGMIRKIDLMNQRVINRETLHDGDVIQKATNEFIKQQEYRKLGEYILSKTKSGDIKSKYFVGRIEDKISQIMHIGDEEDYGTEITDNIEDALKREFRQTIPTGVQVIDALTGGGLGKGEIGLILTPSGVGKAQPLSSKILTPNGWVKMGDIKVDDLVVGSDGKPQRVLGVFPQGKRSIYKMEFNDGTSTMCDLEHLWSVNSLNQRTANTTTYINGKRKNIKTPNYGYKTLTTKELLKSYVINNKTRKKLNYRIPIISPVEYGKKNLKINPYLLGFLIGDGGLSQSSVRFTTVDSELLDKVTSIIDVDYPNLSVKRVSETISYSITGIKGVKNELMGQIKELGLNVLSYNKHIPNEYLFSPIDDRIKLLQGLMDADGYASKVGRVQFSTTSEQLAQNVRELVLSLGGFCKIRQKSTKYKSKDGVDVSCRLCYTLTISFSDSKIKPFSLQRKQERVIYRDKYKSNKYISNIVYSHEEDAQCIYVENPDHLYVTDDYILTHNTTLLTKIANTAYEDSKKVLQIVFEDTVPQVQRKHFAIWSDIGLSSMDENNDIVTERVKKKGNELKKLGGKLIIKRFSQEDTTMKDIRNWIIRYQKKWGYKFDLVVLDYLDCLESHKKTNDRNEAELVIIKSFEAMAGDFNIPCWSAIQSNRTGFDAEFVEAHQSGGSIKRIQKAHFFMSVAKTPEQKEAHLANIRIIKARFAQDGQTFKDCIFNNDTMKIVIEDSRYNNSKAVRGLKKYDSKDIEEFSSELKIHSEINKMTELKEKVNDEGVNEGLNEGVKNAFGNVLQTNTKFDEVKNDDDDAVNDGQTDAVNDVEPEKRDINDLEGMMEDPDEIDKSKDKLFEMLNKIDKK